MTPVISKEWVAFLPGRPLNIKFTVVVICFGMAWLAASYAEERS